MVSSFWWWLEGEWSSTNMEISYPILPLPSSTSVTPCAKPTLIHPRVYMNTSYTQDHLGSWKENGPQQNGNVLPILNPSTETVSRKRSSVFRGSSQACCCCCLAAVTVVPEHLVMRDVNPVLGTRCPCGIIWNMRSSGDLTHVFLPKTPVGGPMYTFILYF